MTYICVNTAATSVQTVSISSLRVCRAKTLSSGSSSVRKARTPVAETIPGILTEYEGSCGRAREVRSNASGDARGCWGKNGRVVENALFPCRPNGINRARERNYKVCAETKEMSRELQESEAMNWLVFCSSRVIPRKVHVRHSSAL